MLGLVVREAGGDPMDLSLVGNFKCYTVIALVGKARKSSLQDFYIPSGFNKPGTHLGPG